MDNVELSKEQFKKEVLQDYRLAYESRQASILGRKEVLTGKAKFGIFGDGKEVAQLAMAKAFQNGDFRSGYYRDQTFMFATGMSSVREFFAQLYAHTDVDAEPASAGRSMNGHFASRSLNPDGSWRKLTEQPNSSADISPTAGQMSRLVGLAWASKLYRDNPDLNAFDQFSIDGNEIAFGTIGNASTSEGQFWESINAAGVLQVPMLVSIWDDEYGISVPAKYQTTKENLSSLLKGFKTDRDGKGYDLYTVKGWDYPELIKTYAQAAEKCRKTHSPAVIHVTEITQPQGHSTSGSHERYKSAERLTWEQEHDCIVKMREWLVKTNLATEKELDVLENEATNYVRDEKNAAWSAFLNPIQEDASSLSDVLKRIPQDSGAYSKAQSFIAELAKVSEPERKQVVKKAHSLLRLMIGESGEHKTALLSWMDAFAASNFDRYSSHLYSEASGNVLNVPEVPAAYSSDSQSLNGFEILQQCFDELLTRDPRVVAFGEDVGKIGDVNQGFAGLQEKHGEIRVMDTGIR
ncbi:MAG: transketolase, partial [Bacteroidetes bacterium]|nr:transketolase [Bacteroidota bacterium]